MSQTSAAPARSGHVLTKCIHVMYSRPMSVPNVPNTLLGLLEREPSHGYELKREYDTYFGRAKPLPFGQVYATLSRLERDCKVSPAHVEPGEGPDRKRYTITDAGREEVEDWLAAPVDPDPYLQTVLFAKVVLALMLGRQAGAYLETQRAVHLQQMREVTDLKRKGNVVDGLLADHALFHLEADLRWMDLTEARLSALAEAVTR
jgi:DNA-binding PadR family transcriptional regulator